MAKPETQLATLLRLAEAAELFRTPAGDLFARVPVGTHLEVCPIREQGRGFRQWLLMRYYAEKRRTPHASAITAALDLITAQAEFAAPTHEVHTRLAEQDGAIYLDLGDDNWQAIKITRTGWSVVAHPPVLFRRPKGMRPLSLPQRGGSLHELKAFFNLASEDDWHLLVAWLIGVFHPSGPYPLLAISGEQGAAKSSVTLFLRELVDPNVAPLRDAPRDVQDLVIAAKNGRVLALDNLSGIPVWLSDALCRMATGSGYGTRALYRDDEETLFQARRPIVFNGIEELTERGDLADRCLLLTRQAIDPHDRKTEAQLQAAWATAQPRILGALLDAVSGALAQRDQIHLADLPRMADFAVWVCAAEPQLGWQPGSFLAAYTRNRVTAVEAEVDASPVAAAVLHLLQQAGGTWKGMPAAFYEAVSQAADIRVTNSPQWPKSAQALSAKLRRLAPALRACGVTVTVGASNGKRYIEVVSRDATVTHAESDASLSPARNAAWDGPIPAKSDASDALFPHFSSVVEEEKERDEGEESERENPGNHASLASLASLNGGTSGRAA